MSFNCCFRSNISAGFVTLVSSYDSARLGGGKSILGVLEYEAGSQFAISNNPVNGTNSATDSISALASRITGLGWNVSAYNTIHSGSGDAIDVATQMNGLLYNFKFSTQYYTVFKLRYQQMIGAFAGREARPAQYGYAGTIWSLFPGDISLGNNYASYTAVHDFNAAAQNYYEGIVSSRCRMMGTTSTSLHQIMCRSAHIASENLTSIRMCFGNFWNVISFGGIGQADAGLGAATTITASIEYPAGTFIQLTFNNGNVSWTIPNAGVLFSDWAGVAIPAGATYWIRKFTTNSAGIAYLPWQNTYSGFGEAFNVAASGLTDQTMGGTITNTIGWSAPPLAILGITNNPSVIIVGDSIAAGYGDTEDSSSTATGFNGKIGVVARSLGNIPFVNIAVSGEQAVNWLADGTARNQIIRKGSHMICELGTNDIANGQTSAQLITSLQGIFALARPGQKIYQTTITPSDSDPGTPSAAFTTLTQQTPNNNPSVTVTFNTAIRSGSSGLTALNGYYEVDNVFESSTNSRKWLVTGSPPYTADGIHPNLAGYLLVPAAGVISPVAWP